MSKVLTTLAAVFLLIGVAQATVVDQLYSAQVPVKSQSAADRNAAIAQAFQSVLVKVSGNSKIVSSLPNASILQNAQNYVHDYSYVESSMNLPSSVVGNVSQASNNTPSTGLQPTLSKDSQTTASTTLEDNLAESATPSLMLQVNFSQKAVNDLLIQVGQAVWQANRPLTLVWMVVKDQSGEHFIHEESQDAVMTNFQQAMTARGLPVIFPILDLSDTLQVRASDVASLYPDAILKASERYSPDAILLVYINMQDSTQITGNWQLLINNQKMRWETDANDLQDIIQTGVDDVTDVLASRYAVIATAGNTNQFNLEVTNLSGVADYAHVMNYLNNLTTVQNVQVLNITPTQADFKLTINGSLVTFEQTLQLDGQLKAMNNNLQSDATDATPTLIYQYTGAGK